MVICAVIVAPFEVYFKYCCAVHWRPIEARCDMDTRYVSMATCLDSLHGNVPRHSNSGLLGCGAEETGYRAEETGYGAEELYFRATVVITSCVDPQ